MSKDRNTPSKKPKPTWKVPLEDHKALKIEEPSKLAGGMPAIMTSLSETTKEMGVLRGGKALLKANQQGGFDCPGCAWPDPDDDRAITEFCENGVKAIAHEATTKVITEEFFQRWSIEALGQQSDYWLNQQGRLGHPMVKEAGGTHYRPIAWEDAFIKMAKHLHALEDPNEAIFYTSGRTSNEAAFLYQLFARMYGTNNLPDSSNMCHESSSVALKEVIGIGKSTVTLEDFQHADAIFILGQNPGTNHPRMLATLQQAARRGCQIVSINPLPEAGTTRFIHPQEFTTWLGHGTPLATLFLPVKVNGDVALLKGLMKELLEREEQQPGTILDTAFIQQYTDGFEHFARALRQVSWDDIVEGSGIPREDIHKAVDLVVNAKSIICTWAMGMTQHKNAVANMQEIINFLLLRGNIGRQGAGPCPVRGHSNVQGDRTMGITENPAPEFLETLGKVFDFHPPRQRGHDAVRGIKAMHEGRAKVFIALGGNFLSATPDTDYTAEALTRCRLTVHISTKLNRAHLVTGNEALILPALGRTDKDNPNGNLQYVTTENTMGIVQASQGQLEPVSPDIKSEIYIVGNLAKDTLAYRKGPGSRINWDHLMDNYDEIRSLISQTILGFENYTKRVQHPGGFYLPNPVRDSRTFLTSTNKANFTVHPLPKITREPGQLLMTTIRSHDQYNTTIYGLDDRYRGVKSGRRVILMNQADMEERGLAKGDLVDITSHHEGHTRTAEQFTVIPYPIPRTCVATYFPEANVLVPIDSVADKSNTPTSKSIVVTVHRHS
ncbi:MAG: FdhF/YdeP family oxidoreductase [Phycisphaerae bacterium]|nr:FdhF/YdeP family oxidoreductase [Phycisphaerae bacterium]